MLFQHTIAEFINSTMCKGLLQLCQLIQQHRTDSEFYSMISFNVSNDLEQSIEAYLSMGMKWEVDKEDNTSTMSSKLILKMFKFLLRTVFVKYHTILQKIILFYNPYVNVHFKVTKEALIQTLHQYFTHPFHDSGEPGLRDS